MGAIDIRGLTYERDGTLIIRGIDLRIDDGGFYVVVGPSGSGKTTLLRLIAGLDEPSSGEIVVDNVDITAVPTRDRDVGMVFQQHSLMPHRSVRRNIGFGLEMRHTPKPEIATRVDAEARATGIVRDLDKKPGTLSEGHRRLAEIARAMVRAPALFLLDEPLAQIDAHHRSSLRRELKTVQSGYGVTTLMVTNDAEEAMVMADHLIVIEDGRVVQVGTPLQVYREPVDTYVAQFVGSYPMGLVPGTIRISAGIAVVMTAGVAIPTWSPGLRSGQTVTAGWRIEDLSLEKGQSWTVDQSHFVGHRWLVTVTRDDADLVVASDTAVPPGAVVGVDLRQDKMHLFEHPSGRAIHHPL